MPVIKDTNIDYLLGYCSEMPDLYNRVTNKLYVQFGIHSAEISLLCTYIVNEFLTEDKEDKS